MDTCLDFSSPTANDFSGGAPSLDSAARGPVVMKFGGTSVQDAAAIRRVVGIVAGKIDRPRVVVVSALAKATDDLLNLARAAADRRITDADVIVTRLLERHQTTARDLLREHPEILAEVDRGLEEKFAQLDRLVLFVARNGVLTAPDTDEIIAFGELLSSAIVAAALRTSGLPAELVDSRDFIVTDDAFTKAVPNLTATRRRVEQCLGPILRAGRIPVVQGFIGGTPDGATTTIGRGGSDYTASLVGAALDAASIDIWTDVDGFMTADPRIVPTARRIDEIAFAEAAELTLFGAKVLHPQTVRPAVEKGIPVHVFNSYNPAGPGTKIADRAALHLVTSIACKRNVRLVRITANDARPAWEFLPGVFAVLGRHRIAPDTLHAAATSVTIVLDPGDPVEVLGKELQAFGGVCVAERKTVLCIVGSNLRATPGIAARALATLANTNVELLAHGASDRGLTLVVEDTETDDALNRLHREFFG